MEILPAQFGGHRHRGGGGGYSHHRRSTSSVSDTVSVASLSDLIEDDYSFPAFRPVLETLHSVEIPADEVNGSGNWKDDKEEARQAQWEEYSADDFEMVEESSYGGSAVEDWTAENGKEEDGKRKVCPVCSTSITFLGAYFCLAHHFYLLTFL